MFILGLTGSIAMGKSIAASMIKACGIAVWDADRAVHMLLAKGGKAVAPIGALFPGVVEDGAVNRGKLGKIVFADKAALKKLEQIIHPLVRQSEQSFLRRSRRLRLPIVVLDIPLLYEQHRENDMDAVLVVTASPMIQYQRVMKRKGMTEKKLRFILQQQLADLAKRQRADYLIHSGLGKAVTRRQIMAVFADIKRKLPCVK